MTPKQILDLRIILGLTQEKFAQKLGVTLKSISNWENGHKAPSPLALEKLESLKKEGLPGAASKNI